MKFYVFGSCRSFNKYFRNNILNYNCHTLLHEANSIFQELQIIYNEKEIIPEEFRPLCYYNSYNQSIKNNKDFYINQKELINKSDFIVIEISTLKTIFHNDLYFDIYQTNRKNNNLLKNINQNINNLKNGVDNILKFCKKINKKILFLGHFYNSYFGNKILVRKNINDYLKSKIDNNFIFYFNFDCFFNNNNIKNYLKDSSHLTNEGIKKYYKELNFFIKNNIKN